MRRVIQAPRSVWLEKLSALPKPAVQHHLSTEETAAFVSGNISSDARKLAIGHLATCQACRRMIADIARSEEAVKDVGESSP